MAYTEIIAEYNWQGHKQVLLERFKGDESGYRVIIVKRAPALSTAQDLFLAELPDARRDMYIEQIQKATKGSVDAVPRKSALPPKRRRSGANGKGQ